LPRRSPAASLGINDEALNDHNQNPRTMFTGYEGGLRHLNLPDGNPE
jgi:hypothetical protein